MKNNTNSSTLQPKIAVIYARYSCDRQNEQSIDGQLRVCKEFADRNNITIVNTYIDKAISGTHDNRDSFQQMLKDSDKKEWDVLLVYKLDRFSRNKYEMAVHRKRLADNGIKIVSAMENIPDSPEGILLESLLVGMNQHYSEELSQKTKRGMHEMRLKGNFIGGFINYGWVFNPHMLSRTANKFYSPLRLFSMQRKPLLFCISLQNMPLVKRRLQLLANSTNAALPIVATHFWQPLFTIFCDKKSTLAFIE